MKFNWTKKHCPECFNHPLLIQSGFADPDMKCSRCGSFFSSTDWKSKPTPDVDALVKKALEDKKEKKKEKDDIEDILLEEILQGQIY